MSAVEIKSSGAAPHAEKSDITLKLVMCGDSAVGKSNLLSRYTKNMFMEDSKSTIGAEFATRTIKVPYKGDTSNMKNVKLQIWDTAGQERYRSITRTYYRDAYGCILVYSVVSKKSWKHLDRWVEEIRQNGNKDPEIALVGNKADLGKQKIAESVIEAFAQTHSLPVSAKTSAKTGDGVEEAFLQLVLKIFESKPELWDTVKDDKKSVQLDASNADTDGKKKKGCC